MALASTDRCCGMQWQATCGCGQQLQKTAIEAELAETSLYAHGVRAPHSCGQQLVRRTAVKALAMTLLYALYAPRPPAEPPPRAVAADACSVRY